MDTQRAVDFDTPGRAWVLLFGVRICVFSSWFTFIIPVIEINTVKAFLENKKGFHLNGLSEWLNLLSDRV
jgi:hypothetical protein